MVEPCHRETKARIVKIFIQEDQKFEIRKVMTETIDEKKYVSVQVDTEESEEQYECMVKEVTQNFLTNVCKNAVSNVEQE